MDDSNRLTAVEVELWGKDGQSGFCEETRTRLTAIEVWKETGRFVSCPYLQGKERRGKSFMKTLGLVTSILSAVVSMTAIILFLWKLLEIM